ncbi:MAG: hypothetical protein ABJE47_19160 [bacterium]
MRYTVKLQNVIVGHSELEEVDASLGRAWGEFRPGVGYGLVQPIFNLFTQAVPMPGGEPMDTEKLARYHTARERLGLELVDASGQRIATTAIHIADYSGRTGAMALDVLISDADYWKSR